MKLTKSQEKKLRKKLKVKASAENEFVSYFMESIEKAIGDKIKNAKSYYEVEDIINNIDIKALNKQVKKLQNDLLLRNHKGYEHIIKAMSEGIVGLKNKRKQEKIFAKAIRALPRERTIFKPLLERFQANMKLIKDLPKDVYRTLKKGYFQGIGFRGTRIEKELTEKLKNRAKLIVRTESAKLNSALTEIRSKSVGVKCFIWATGGDQRVRPSHEFVDGMLFFWNDPPKLDGMGPAPAGNYPNCRCIPLPVFAISDIKFPVKVGTSLVVDTKRVGKGKYKAVQLSGSVITYTKEKFIKTFGDIFVQ